MELWFFSEENEMFSPNISIAISSAVVSYGRIKINELKHLKDIKVYYSDTDKDLKIPCFSMN